MATYADLTNSFTSLGWGMFYSDGPEDVTKSYAQTLLKHMKDGKEVPLLRGDDDFHIGMYHNNNSGSSLKFGFLVYNKGNSAAEIEILRCFCKPYAPNGTNGSFQKNKINLAAVDELAFMNDSSYSNIATVSIPAGAKKMLFSTIVPNGYGVNSHAEIYVNKGDDCYIRAVAGAIDSSDNSLWTDIDSGECAEGQFAGLVEYSKKRLMFSYSSSKSKFYLWDVKDGLETHSEYTDVIYAKDKGKKYFAGNYGIEYELRLSNIRDKKLKITPYWNNTNNYYARILVNNPVVQTSWYSTTTIERNESWVIPLGSNSSIKLGLLLPGGNCGKMTCEIVDS